MEVVKSSVRWVRKNLFFIVFVFVTIASIYALFPKIGVNKFEFQKGNPWRHKSLIAPFDFPILKTKEEVDAERDSIKKNFIPYITYDSAIVQKHKLAFEKDLNDLIVSGKIKLSLPERTVMVDSVEMALQSSYNAGIIDNASYTSLQQLDKGQVYFVRNNVAELRLTPTILTLKMAYVGLTGKIPRYFNDLSSDEALGLFDWSNYLETNLSFDVNTNQKLLEEQLSAYSTTRGVVQAGERIISEGDIVTNKNYMLLESLQEAYKKNSLSGGWVSGMVIGKMLLTIVLVVLLVFYLELFSRNPAWKKRNFALVFSNVLITFLMARLIYSNPTIGFYAIPICILPIVIRTFQGVRMAVFVHFITTLLIGFLAPNSFEFVFIQFIAGTVAAISVNRLHRRGHLIVTALVVAITYAVTFIGFEIIKEDNFRQIDWSQLKWFGLSSFLIMIAYPLIFIYEKVFGFVSDVTLMELSDTNHPLLRRLAEEAPGTFQHALQVANLAEAAIAHIGGNPMLVRTGALYHDVGKITNPHYFIENQMGGENPHDSLSYLDSASIIIDHVNEGVTLAKKYKIPDLIIDFIWTHHGDGLTRYFYLKHKEENPGEDAIDKFRYPGNKPNTKETVVLMLADSVEAATRSLPVKNNETLKSVIDQIIDFKQDNHELDDAPLTFRDITDIKTIFLRKLINIYHIRMQYPVEAFLQK